MLETIKNVVELYYNTLYILFHFCKYYFYEKTLNFRLAWKNFWRSLGVISEWDEILDFETIEGCL
jgi:hypothetical protein